MIPNPFSKNVGITHDLLGRKFGLSGFLYVDRDRIQIVLQMHRIVLLDHLHTRPAVLGNLVTIRAFQQPERDVSVPQGIECAPIPIVIEFQVFFIQIRLNCFL